MLEAAGRLDIPFMAIDVGQQENGQWRILEIADAQVANLNPIPIPHFWYELSKIATQAELAP